MAGDSNLNLVMRIRADVAQASQSLKELSGDITDTGTAAAASARKLDEQSRAQGKVTETARGQAQAEQSVASVTSQTGNAVGQAATEYAGYQAALARTRAEMGALQNGVGGTTADINAQREALASLVNRIDPVVAAYGRLDEMEEQLNAFRGAGLVGDDDFEQYSTRLNEMRLQVEKAAHASTEAGRQEATAAREAAQAETQQAASKAQFINRLREQAETMNLSTRELLEYKAAQLGITDEAAPFIQKLSEQSSAMKYGSISAGQYAQAMKYLPMQMTDVVTSLASGMPLWMVAIQQGGQVADSFGGLGNIFEIIASKFRDVSSSSDDAGDSLTETAGDAAEGAEKFRSLLSGATLARVGLVGVAAAIAAVGYAAYSASDDQDKFNQSIQKSGNFAGTTAGQLEDMASRIGGFKSNYGDVRDILNGLVSSGKLTGETLESVAQAASTMAELSGQSADQVVSQFLKMADGASSWAASTNQQYHFLDLETYQRIQNLEDQGRKEEAIELAAKAFNESGMKRLQEMEKRLNWVARAWGNVKDAVNDAWEGIKDKVAGALGIDSLDEQIATLEKRVSDGGYFAGTVFMPVRQSDRDELALKKQQRDEKLKTAEMEGKRKQADADTISAAEKLHNLWKGNRTEMEKTADATEETRKSYETMWRSESGRKTLQSRGVTSTDGKNFSGGQWDTDIRALDKSGQKAEQYNKQLQQTLNQKKALTELDRVEAEIRDGILTSASREEQNKARTLAKQIDATEAARKASQESARATKQEAEENQRFVEQLQKQADKRVEGSAATRAQEIATRNLTAEQRRQAEAANAAITAQEFQGQNLQLQLEYMRDTGDTAGASLLEVRNKFANLRREFEASGNTEGLSLLDRLMPVAETKIRVDDLKKQLEDLFTYQSQQETSIQAQVQGGLLNEIQGRQRLAQLHQEVGDKIKSYLPQLKELATAPGEAGEKIREMIRQLEGELGKLNQAGNELTQAFREGLQNGIESSLMGLAKGTMNLSDAVKNLALSIVNSMAQIASQQLAQMATSSLIGSSGGIGGLLGSVFAADGGQVRGAGTTTSDSIPAMLSDQEYVVRASVVQQPGALAFLHEYNRFGMAALEGWLPRVRHNTGGLAGIPAQNMPVPASVAETAMATPAGSSVTPISLQQQLVFDAGEAYTAGANTLAGQRQFRTQLRSQVPTLKQWLNIK